MLEYIFVSHSPIRCGPTKRDADVAQMVAHLIGNEEVGGSIPLVSFQTRSP